MGDAHQRLVALGHCRHCGRPRCRTLPGAVAPARAAAAGWAGLGEGWAEAGPSRWPVRLAGPDLRRGGGRFRLRPPQRWQVGRLPPRLPPCRHRPPGRRHRGRRQWPSPLLPCARVPLRRRDWGLPLGRLAGAASRDAGHAHLRGAAGLGRGLGQAAGPVTAQGARRLEPGEGQRAAERCHREGPGPKVPGLVTLPRRTLLSVGRTGVFSFQMGTK
mmetsp:Transcript_116818/g.342058  ORF Transcript_116818/g.342058 Transcript_116818/m.342058 type:complete len:216 (+) Transcript_116818:85-732(+)